MFSNEDGSSARNFMLSSTIWLIAGSLLGRILSIKMSDGTFAYQSHSLRLAPLDASAPSRLPAIPRW